MRELLLSPTCVHLDDWISTQMGLSNECRPYDLMTTHIPWRLLETCL